MKKSVFLALSASVFLASGFAQAQDMWGNWNEGWRQGMYVRGSGGVTMSNDQEYSSAGGDVSAEPDSGWTGSAALGMDYGQFRTELEGSYRSDDVDSLSVGGVGTGGASGSTDVWSAMINGYYDIPTGLPFTPYLGAGVGLAHVNADDIDGGGLTSGGSDNVFAYQAMAGAEYAFNEDWSAMLEYRYFAADNVDISSTVGGVTTGSDFDYHSHTVMAGLRYNLN